MRLHRWADVKMRKLTAAAVAEIEASADEEARQAGLGSPVPSADTEAPQGPRPLNHHIADGPTDANRALPGVSR